MAKQIGVIKLTGMLGDLILYEDPDDGALARAKGYITGEKVKTHPDYAHTMDNAMEFKAALYSAKLLRRAVDSLLFPIADSKLSGRMNRVMLDMVQQDRVNQGDERVAYEGDPKSSESGVGSSESGVRPVAGYKLQAPGCRGVEGLMG